MRARFSIPVIALAALLAAPAAGVAQRRGPAPGRMGRGPAAEREPGVIPRPPGPGWELLDRFGKMSPDERRRALENLPPERRQRIEERLERFESLPPEQRERLRRQYQRFRQLPPERQEAARKLFRDFTALPEDRRHALRQEVRRLERMDEAGRRSWMSGEEFQSRYTSQEQEMLRDLLDLRATDRNPPAPPH